MTAAEIIAHLGLQPLPIEGGYFRQTYCSPESLAACCLPPRYRGTRPFGTAIYYLLTAEPDSFSALHRLSSDEVYHFYLGDPVEMLLLHPDGGRERVVLGPDLLHGQRVQFVVPRGVWQGACLLPGGQFALLGTTVAPGFHGADFECGGREELVAQYPAQAQLIRTLTRS